MVPFLAFTGVGPRRCFDLFSLMLSTGYPVERQKDGGSDSYLERKRLAWQSLHKLLSDGATGE